MALAQPDQIIVSAPTATLTAESGAELVDPGQHDLRGIEGPRHLYAVA